MTSTPAWDCGTPKSTHTAFSWHDPLRNPPKPKNKTGPKRTKQERAAMAFETDEERSIRVKATNQAKRDKILRENKNQFVPETRASKDRTAAISGKSIYLGSNP